MNAEAAQSPWKHLRTLAADIAGAWRPLPFVWAVVLVGSVAEGRADDLSDLDLWVLQPGLPTAEQGDALRRAVDGSPPVWAQFKTGTGERAWDAEMLYFVRGVPCQVHQWEASRWEEGLREVLERHNPASGTQAHVQAVLGAVPLCGTEHLRPWQDLARVYPPALGEAMVRRHLRFLPRVWLFALADRPGEGVAFWKYAVRQSGSLLGILAGLNRLYFHTSTLKHARALIERMAVAPPDLAGRWQRLQGAAPPVACELLDGLICDTFDLLAEHMPQLDVRGEWHVYGSPARASMPCAII